MNCHAQQNRDGDTVTITGKPARPARQMSYMRDSRGVYPVEVEHAEPPVLRFGQGDYRRDTYAKDMDTNAPDAWRLACAVLVVIGIVAAVMAAI